MSSRRESTDSDPWHFAPDRVGPYRLLREIGSGGASRVYLAVRDDGHFQQEVAVKLFTGSLDTVTRVRRFRTERQILARLVHPNIAQIHDGGAAGDGRLYFVLEYVDGRPIHQYCREEGLSLERRLELFCDVCSAVSFAHQNLIVHRDLKPANILVTEAGVVKLLDFGIAKILEPEGFPQDVELTRTDHRPMTLLYASPEQLRGEPVTTATDVYALGLLLYELLTGQQPLPLRGLSRLEVERVVCEKEPRKPSDALLGARAAGRATRASQLAGDLDNIVLKALEKPPHKRYSSSRELAEDVRRYLEGRPVDARPVTFWYRGAKFLRRHAVAVGVAGAFLVLLVGFIAALAAQSVRIARERDQARSERDRAEQISSFLVDIFAEADPGQARVPRMTAQEILDRGAERVRRDLEGQPLLQARLMSAIGNIYLELGLYEAAGPLLRQGLEIRLERLGEDSIETASSFHDMAVFWWRTGEYERRGESSRAGFVRLRSRGSLPPYRRLRRGDRALRADTRNSAPRARRRPSRRGVELDGPRHRLSVRRPVFRSGEAASARARHP